MMKMIGFRNIAAHEYQKLNPDVVQTAVEKHVVETEVFAGAVIKSL